MKQSLEQLIIAFTTESQIQSLARNYCRIAKNDDEKEIVDILKIYIKKKEILCTQLLELIQDIKDKIGEYNNDNEWAIEIGGNIGINDSYANIQRLIKMENYFVDVIYPECADDTANEGLIEISEQIWTFVEKSKEHIKIFQKIVS